MVTTTTVSKETENVIAMPLVKETESAAIPVDVLAIPETPEELLKQWTGADKISRVSKLVSGVVAFFAAFGGPAMTDQQKAQRELAEGTADLRIIWRSM